MLELSYDGYAEAARKDWQRVPARETGKTAAPLKVGARVAWSRSIERVGYYFSPLDMPAADLEIAAYGLLRHRTADVSERDLRTVLDALGDQSRHYWVFQELYREVRQSWLELQRGDYLHAHPESRAWLNLRTFWYREHARLEGVIVARKNHVVGAWYPPSHDWDTDDVEPGGLAGKFNQVVYVVEIDHPRHWPDYGGLRKVHPADAEPVTKEAV